MEESTTSLLNEIRERLELLESSLPSRVDAMAVSPTAKLPFKALCFRETLIWRMTELSRSAFESFENNKIASAILLTRGAVETSAALWYLCGKIEATTQSGVVGNIDDYLMRLVVGSKTDPVVPNPIHVMDFIRRVDKDVDGFLHQYDSLSEFAHPNWAGTTLLYSKDDPTNLWTDFGANFDNENSKHIGVVNLSVALMFFERSYNRICALIPGFITLCESQLKG
jgi:hypothetical protein